MSTLLLERPPIFERDSAHDPHDRWEGGLITGRVRAHGRLTLDDLVTGVWEGLAVRATVACPVCEGPMTSGRSGDGEVPPTGICADCGSQLC